MSLGTILILSAVAIATLVGGFFFSMLVISKRSDEAIHNAFEKALAELNSKEKP